LRKAVLVALIVLHAGQSVQSQTSTNVVTPETDRVIAAGKLWATVKYFHPYLAYREIDWDKALVEALPQIRSAQNGSDYVAALELMLEVLHDPATYAFPDTPIRQNAAIHFQKGADGILVVSQIATSQPAADSVQQLIEALKSADKVVFDLRTQPGEPDLLSKLLDENSVAQLLTRNTIEGPAQRTLVHNGLPTGSQKDESSGYYSAFLTRPGTRIEASSTAPERRLAFLLNDNSPLPRIGSALLSSGKAHVLAESSHFEFADMNSTMIPMGQGVAAKVRLSEPVTSRAVRVVAHEAALAQTIDSLVKPDGTPMQAAILPASAPLLQTDRSYIEMRYPSVEYRILAAYETWAAFRNFFAYRDLMDEDWDEVFRTFLPRLIAAKNARDYNLALAEMLTHTADSHTSIESAELDNYYGKAPVGLRLRLVEKKPVITQVSDPEASKAGVQAGDIVIKVDGESITERFHREERYIAGSTQQALGSAVMQRILNGPEGSEAALTIEGADGQKREVHLKRTREYLSMLTAQRSGEVIKILPGNIGYVDLDRLLPDQVDGMFEQLRSTKAIIFDMRGYPHESALSIAPRLTERQDVPAAIINGPLSLAPDLPFSELSSSASYFFVQKLPSSEKWKYSGKTVMLIDERTIGQGEHTALFFEAANRTEFVGTPSAGAIGDVTNFVVPGGITIQFSGHDVRHANGGALQRLGLQPGITVAPTISGIRGGTDEVLEKAIEYLSPTSQKASLRKREIATPNVLDRTSASISLHRLLQ
jgi:C-terminal processing protease CtpA/Prc